MSHWDFGRPPADEHDASDDTQLLAGDRWIDEGDVFMAGDQSHGWPPGSWISDQEASTGTGEEWDDDAAPYPLTYEREAAAAPPADLWAAAVPAAPGAPGPALAEPAPPGPPGTGAAGTEAYLEDWLESYEDQDRRRRGSGGRGRRWLIPAGLATVAAAVGATAVLLTSGHSAGGSQGSAQGAGTQGSAGQQAPQGTAGLVPSSSGASSGAPSASGAASGTASAAGSTSPAAAGGAAGPPLTLAEAQAVLASYTTANNAANAARSATELAAIETGSSDAIDAALYRAGQAAGSAPFPAFTPAQSAFYLPRDEPAAGPRWFVVQVGNAFAANPAKVTSTEYLLFTQSVPGGAWRDAIEPYLLPSAGAPQIALGADGLATAVAPDATADAVAPGQLPAATAASLDGTGAGQVTTPGNLADAADQQLWRKDVPNGSVTGTHAAAAGTAGQEFALRTADGGALVLFTDSATVTVTPPAGSALHVTIPGFLSPGQAMAKVTVTYLEQFASYDPPAGSGAPRVVADYSAITGTG